MWCWQSVPNAPACGAGRGNTLIAGSNPAHHLFHFHKEGMMDSRVWKYLESPCHFTEGKVYRWRDNDGEFGEAERKCIGVLPDDLNTPGENRGQFENYSVVLYATAQFEELQE